MAYNNDWQTALNEQEQENRRMIGERAFQDMKAVDDEIGGIDARERQMQSQQLLQFQNTLGSVMKRTPQGGDINPVFLQYMNRVTGGDGRTTGILGGGYDQNGNFCLRIGGGVDGMGNPIIKDSVISPAQQYQMMNVNRVAFNDNDRMQMRDRLLKSGYGEREVMGMEFNPFGQGNPNALGYKMATGGGGAGGREIGGATMKGRDTTPSRVSYFSADGKGGFSKGAYDRKTGENWGVDYGTRDPNRAARWKVIESHADYKRYENDKTGEVVKVKNGETPPWENRTINDRYAIEQMRQENINARQAANNQNRLAIAQLNADQRKKATEAANALKKLGIDIGIDLAEAKAAEATANSMGRATTGITQEARYTPKEIAAQKKKAEEARSRARVKVGSAASSRQASPSSGDNSKRNPAVPTVSADGKTITMPDGTVLKPGESWKGYVWGGKGAKDFKKGK